MYTIHCIVGIMHRFKVPGYSILPGTLYPYI